MKICVFALKDVPCGKCPVKDPRLDQVEHLSKSKKKTYVQIELVGEDGLSDADAILASQEARTDLLLKDLEFTETRLSRVEDEFEKALLLKVKTLLEGESLLSQHSFTEEEHARLSPYGLITRKPITFIDAWDQESAHSILQRLLAESGYISFFTSGEKETRAWLIRKGATAWEAAGQIHSDIQRGFIRAEVIALDDYLQCGGETGAKQAGKMRLEQKDYLLRDAEIVVFRFNR